MTCGDCKWWSQFDGDLGDCQYALSTKGKNGRLNVSASIKQPPRP